MFIKHIYLPAVLARFIAYKLRSMLLLHTFFTGTYAKLACCMHEAWSTSSSASTKALTTAIESYECASCCCSAFIALGTLTIGVLVKCHLLNLHLAAVGTALSQSGAASEQELEAIAGYWQCRQCTSANTDLDSTVCNVCGNTKQTAA